MCEASAQHKPRIHAQSIHMARCDVAPPVRGVMLRRLCAKNLRFSGWCPRLDIKDSPLLQLMDLDISGAWPADWTRQQLSTPVHASKQLAALDMSGFQVDVWRGYVTHSLLEATKQTIQERKAVQDSME